LLVIATYNPLQLVIFEACDEVILSYNGSKNDIYRDIVEE